VDKRVVIQAEQAGDPGLGLAQGGGADVAQAAGGHLVAEIQAQSSLPAAAVAPARDQVTLAFLLEFQLDAHLVCTEGDQILVGAATGAAP